MKNNIEIFNYLNLIDPKLGKLYKIKGINPISSDFEFNEENILERLKLNQMQNFSLPEFVFKEKKEIKKKLKNSIKNLEKLIKNQNFANFSDNFNKKLDFYLKIRKIISKQILKEFKNYDFNEIEAFKEIYNLDPILGELLEEIFNDNVDFHKLFDNLEERYNISYREKLKLLEEKEKKKKKTLKIENVAKIEKTPIKQENKAKNTEKSVKIEKTQKIKTTGEREKQ